MNNQANCSVCLQTHFVPQYGFAMTLPYCIDRVKRGQSNVSIALTFSKNCATAVAGDAFKEFQHNKDTNEVIALLNDRKIVVLTTDGYEGDREMEIPEIKRLVINKFKEIMQRQ